ncbi:MAG: phosphotransferase [Herpetosiphonaceae bacterium]|nr:phosphotransferase [Herpetosiphonaceae bacterium]
MISTDYAAILERHQLPAPTTITPLTPYTVLLDETILLHLSDGPQPVLSKVALIERQLLGAGIPVAEVLALDTSREYVAGDLLIERVPAGVVAGEIWQSLTRTEQEALSEALGTIIARVHNLAWPGYGDFDPAQKNFGLHGRWIEALVERITALSTALQDGLVLPARLVDGAIIALNDGDSLIETASPPTLIHCALSWDHVRLQQREGGWQIAALMGWSGAIVADEAWELAELWLHRNHLYPDPDCFLGGYRSLHQPQLDRRARRDLYRLLIHLEGALAAHQASDIFRYARHEAALLRLLRK